MTIRILGDQVIPQAIEDISSTKLLPLGTIVRGVDTATNLEADYIYALGVASTVASSAVFIDPVTFASALATGAGGGIAAVAIAANVANSYGWYKVTAEVSGLYSQTTATLTVTSALAGKTIVFDKADGITVTLPAAAGTGNKYRFVVKTALSGASAVVKVANSSDVMTGNAYTISDDAAAVLGYKTASTDDTITFNATTTGGKAGDVIEVEDIAANLFAVKVLSQSTGTEATPFSATV